MRDGSTSTGIGDGGAPSAPGGRPLAFHTLSFRDDDDEVTVGRPDQGAFVVLPADGAALLRQLVDGRTCDQAAEWYLAAYGEPIDVVDFVSELGELGFLRTAGEAMTPLAPVRWQRLGRAVFSPLAAMLYLALLVGCVVAMVRSPALIPHYGNLFFTHYMSVLIVTSFLAQMPLILLHEAAHALAGRRLGLRSRLSIGRRLYYLVFQTTMDALVVVPRRQRYLPILAGMFTDIGVLAGLTLFAAATRQHDGTLAGLGGFALAMAYLTLLRLLWQCWFFLETDVYHLVVTVLGCVNLHATTRQLLANQLARLLGRAHRYDPLDWHPTDRKAARWFSVLMVGGYGFCVATLLITVLPAVTRMFGTVLDRLTGSGGRGGAGLLDSVVFLVLSVGEIVVVLVFVVRDRRARRAAANRVASSPA